MVLAWVICIAPMQGDSDLYGEHGLYTVGHKKWCFPSHCPLRSSVGLENIGELVDPSTLKAFKLSLMVQLEGLVDGFDLTIHLWMHDCREALTDTMLITEFLELLTIKLPAIIGFCL